MTIEEHLLNLNRPIGTVDVVLDTDAYNEIDDQYAIAYLMNAQEKLHVKALYAAPFFNEKAAGPKDGMEKSHAEILHILRLMGREADAPVFKGSEAYMPDEHTPVPSPAALDLSTRAMAYGPKKPLYVAAIGAITNVASALLLAPRIAENIVIIWLGGHAHHWPNNNEFNLRQDIAAARVVFGCGAPLVQLPCAGIVDSFRTTGPELAHWLKGKNALCDYLYENTVHEAEGYAHGTPWSRVIWDVTTIGWLMDEKSQMMKDLLVHAPIPEYDGHYAFDPTRPLMRAVYHIDRDRLFDSLFRHLTR